MKRRIMDKCTPEVLEIAARPDKLSDRQEYINATGYRVTVRGTYTRTRRVRALTPEQALEFAMAREAAAAPKYFGQQVYHDYMIEKIEGVDAREVDMRDD